METTNIKNIFYAIGNRIPRDDNEKKYKLIEDQIRLEIYLLSENREYLKELIPFLFVKYNKTPKDILHVLRELSAHLHFNEYSYHFIGIIFLEISTFIGQSTVEAILSELKEDKKFKIFGIVNSLPFIFSEYKLQAPFAADWFYVVGERIKSDLASGDFFKSLDNQAYYFPEEALKILEIYLNQKFSGLQVVLGSIILGSIRAAIRIRNVPIQIDKIETELSKSHHEDFRVVNYKSWITTYYRNESSIEEIIKIIRLSYDGTPKEQDESFNISSRILIKDLNDNHTFNQILNWYNIAANNRIPAEGKFQVINSIYWIATFDKNEHVDQRLNDFKQIFEKLLPIEPEFLGIWKKIEELLISLLNRKKEVVFNDYLKIIVVKSPNSFIELLNKDNFRSLEYYLSGSLADLIFTKLLVSENDVERKVALELFRKLIKLSITPDEFNPSEELLTKILFEFSRNILLAEGTSKFLTMIEPYFRNVNDELKFEFKKEMLFQAVNYPGACLDKWKKIENPSEILRTVIERADIYFDKLNETKDLPGRSFSFYEFVEGAKLERKVQSRLLNQQVKEKSVLLKLVRHTQVLYGDRWSIKDDLDNGQSSKFQELKYTVEFPRMENIDPEGMVLKRLFINTKLLK